MFQKILFILLIITFISCKKSDSNSPEDTEKAKIKTARWLIGTWENKSAEGNLKEIWNKVNDSTYEGQSYFIKGKDTIHFEKIQLQQKGEELTYSPTVRGQNDDKPVAFQLTNVNDKELIFENPKHDYPQKISYKNVSKDSLVAEISGLQSGKPSSEKYLMKKVK
ncbi:DUF6265 family protein [Flavobacterium degerlachei]|jgi:hypothetical protein|uniref:DUF6265 domain-containing protein n=1 Tax=Flavobacterium degerlachei TaxID=229203 RepID=A0A1H2XC96_9FLAO|nr:DUF6265 family protein [Flavobacterium degerlachei]SDW90552.1 hypothetical protein SAMN05444338_105210 [Flavobacterium degerlachei]